MVEWLREHHPTPYPTQVYLERIPGRGVRRTDGITLLDERKLRIILDNRLTWAEMIEVLIHEWAHAMDWRHARMENRRDADHSESWGLYYARIYRDVHDFHVLDPPEEDH